MKFFRTHANLYYMQENLKVTEHRIRLMENVLEGDNQNKKWDEADIRLVGHGDRDIKVEVSSVSPRTKDGWRDHTYFEKGADKLFRERNEKVQRIVRSAFVEVMNADEELYNKLEKYGENNTKDLMG